MFSKKIAPEIIFLIYLIIGIIVSAILTRLLPHEYYRKIVFQVLGFGICFDLLSLFYGILGVLERRQVSGFPGLSLIFYVWFLIASNYSLNAIGKHSWIEIVLSKIIDAGILWGFSYLCHIPFRFQPSNRDRD